MNQDACVTIAAALSPAERAAVIDARQVVTVVPERSSQRELIAEPQPETPLSTISAKENGPLTEPEEPADEPIPEVIAEAAPDPVADPVPDPTPEPSELTAS